MIPNSSYASPLPESTMEYQSGLVSADCPVNTNFPPFQSLIPLFLGQTDKWSLTKQFTSARE